MLLAHANFAIENNSRHSIKPDYVTRRFNASSAGVGLAAGQHKGNGFVACPNTDRENLLMKKKRPSQSGFFHPRVLLGFVLGSVGVLLALVGFGISSGASALAQNSKARHACRHAASRRRKIAPEVLADTANGKSASVVILLAEQADVSAAYGMKDQDARGWFVYNTLTQHAARTQASLQAFLTAQGASYQSFWAANMIVATADRSLVESLAARADVARIDSNKPARWIEDPEVANFEVTPSSPTIRDGGVGREQCERSGGLGAGL